MTELNPGVITSKNTTSFTLGIVAVVMGVLALLIGWIPFLGLFAIPIALIGGLLAAIGLIIAFIKGFRGIGLPLIGEVLCVFAVIIPLISTGTAAVAISERAEKTRHQMQQEVTNDGITVDSIAAGVDGEEEVETTKHAEPIVQDELFLVGQPFQLGDYKYIIDKVEQAQAIGDISDFGLGQKASRGAVFLIISFTIENMTNETQTVLSDDFKLVDVHGRKFSPSSDATTALAMEFENQDWLLSEIQPGLPSEQMTAFEIPANSISEGLHLLIPEKGFFSTGEAKVNLMRTIVKSEGNES